MGEASFWFLNRKRPRPARGVVKALGKAKLGETL